MKLPIVAGLLCAAGLLQAQQFDITGYALGGDYDAAVNSLVSKGFVKQTVYNFPWPEMKAVAFGPPPERLPPGVKPTKPSENYMIQSLNNKIVYVWHLVQFRDGGEANVEETLDNLKKKYGTTLTLAQNEWGMQNWRLIWFYGATGTVAPTMQSLNCGVSGSGAPINRLDTRINCSKGVDVSVNYLSSNKKLVPRLTAAIQDDAALKPFFVKVAQGQRDAANAVIEKSKQNKAPM